MTVTIFRAIAAFLIVAAAQRQTPIAVAFQRESPSEVLAIAAQRGTQMLAALRDYTFDSELTIQSVSQADTISGKLYRFSRVSYDRAGNRREAVLENSSTLPKDFHVGASTINELIAIYHFVITPETLSRYDISYIGREQIDELNTLVFDVKPKSKSVNSNRGRERFLKGRIWIDDQDHCVVRVSGEVIPQHRGRTARFETYFQNYGSLWLPSYVSGDDFILVDGYYYRVIVNLRYTGYKKVSANR